MKQFAPGDRVHIANLGAGIVREARSGRRYLVEIKGRTIIIGETQLDFAAPERDPRKDSATSAAPADDRAVRSGAGFASLDLHGKTVLEAIGALDVFLNDAMLEGRHEIHVIHGRGAGRLRTAVHRCLSEVPSVRAFRLDPVNPGVTIVTL